MSARHQHSASDFRHIRSCRKRERARETIVIAHARLASGAIAAGVLLAALASTACAGDACAAGDAPEPTAAQQVLLDPSAAALQATPPDTFHVLFETSRGNVTFDVVTAWAPIGAGRFYNLVRNGFFDGNRFFRVIPGGIVQFGVSGVPDVQAAWNEQALPDDPVRASNLGGTLVFATAGPNTRTTQMFVNYRDNEHYDSQGFSPIGRVTEGMGALLQLYSDYGEMAGLGGAGVDYQCMLAGGEAYIARDFDRMDRIIRATIIDSGSATEAT
jgi:peptidyl-prolyl cis-trans isomerase A (cyclophilin A)